MENRPLVLGVGNSFRHDDGIGSRIISILQQQSSAITADLLDGGIDGLALLDKIEPYSNVIIIDAVNMGRDPGNVQCFAAEDVRLKIKSDALSTHGFGLAELITLMQNLNIQTNIKIIGIEPQNVDFGEGLSAIVEQKVPEILTIVKDEVSCITHC